MFQFQLPEIGEGVIEGEVVRWLVAEGDLIAEDQPICEIMTDKATIEISTPRSGKVTRLHHEEGDVVAVHTPLVDIATDIDGPVSAPAPRPSAPAKTTPPATPAPAQPVVVTAEPTAEPKKARSPGTKALATPAVRRHARELGLDLQAVAGTGKDGRVTHVDVDTHTVSRVPAAAPTPSAPAAVPQSKAIPSGTEERIKIIGLRRKIGAQMLLATQSAPHFTYVEEIDVTELVKIRQQLKGLAADRGVKLTYLPFIMKACSVVFQAFPNVNAVVENDPFTLVVKGDVNIGVATDTPQGLFVPVIKNVEQKSVLQIAAEMADLTARTRSGQVRADELQGGTFTVTSVGNIGGVFATPILNVPEVAILGVNRIVKRPMVVEGEIAIRDMMYLSPSFDHRIIDGAVAARFVAALKKVLETPTSLLLDLA
jgi:pyruvate dehydrogenase E2 component (dihydrolipoamide acetyltransferase)